MNLVLRADSNAIQVLLIVIFINSERFEFQFSRFFFNY